MRTKTIIENGGKGLLDHYKQSLSALLTKVYPEVSWDPLHFTKTPKKFWSSLENQRKFMDEIGIKLGIESGKESRGGWYKVSTQAVLDQGGRALLGQYCFPSLLLTAVLPSPPVLSEYHFPMLLSNWLEPHYHLSSFSLQIRSVIVQAPLDRLSRLCLGSAALYKIPSELLEFPRESKKISHRIRKEGWNERRRRGGLLVYGLK